MYRKETKLTAFRDYAIILIGVICLIIGSIIPSLVWGAFIDDHVHMIYPVVRVTVDRGGGSGTVIYSKGDDKYSTYVLTNYHVIDDAITIRDEWDSDRGEEVKIERRAMVYVEIFQYRDISTPIGTLKIEAEIVMYNRAEDMALLKLRSETPIQHVATLAPKDREMHVFEPTTAVGCSLLFPPLPTTGVLTRKNFFVQSLPFHMSSAQIIYGNSGGAMFDSQRRLVGIPSMVAVVGWGTPVTHMGLFIPIERFYEWLEKEKYDFIFDESVSEADGLAAREKLTKEREKTK